MNKNLFLVLIVCWSIGCTPKAALYRQNSEFRYDADRTFYYDLRREGDSLHVFLKLMDPAVVKSRNSRLYYLVNLSYEREEIVRRDSIPAFGKRLQVRDNYGLADFKIPLAGFQVPAVLQLQVRSWAGDAAAPYMDIPLSKDVLTKNYLLTDSTQQQPLFRDYVHTREAFYFEAFPPAEVLQVKRYESDFPAALPPFPGGRRKVPPVLSLLGSWKTRGRDTIRLREPGLYQLEGGGAKVTLMVAESPYPDLTTARDLIEPLIYLTTAKEREALYQAEVPKLALDRFWLDVANQNKDRARQLIKLYYSRVKLANQFFSSHKAGWMTDRGMIYVIFGKPDVVNRRQQSEEWIYRMPQEGGRDIKFNFIKKPNTFTQNHYEVDRRLEYEFLWYSTVEKWRKGIILGD